MKLKNLLFATMFACAFASCSNEDDPINNKPAGEGEAALNIKIAAPTTTKATVDPSATITTLNVYVFKNGSLEAKGSLKTGSSIEAEVTGLTADTKKVLVLANYELSSTITTLADALTATKDFAGEVDGDLSMNSKVYDITITPGATNYLGYTQAEVTANSGAYLGAAGGDPVYLFRNVAKVVLSSVAVNINPIYGAPTVTPKKVFILHGAKTTKVATNDMWAATATGDNTWVNAAGATTYGNWVAIMAGKTMFKAFLPSVADGDSVIAYTKNYSTEVPASFYVYENANGANTPQPLEVEAPLAINTLLVLEADYTLNGATVTRYYPVSVGLDAVDANNGKLTLPNSTQLTRSEGGVIRNLQYNVSLTITGPGYTTPFGPKDKTENVLDVKVQVVPFGTVTQNPSIE